jgi:hypothetical protein
LAATVAYDFFSAELFLLLTDPFSRNLIKETLLQTYFPHTRQNLTGAKKEGGYIHQLEHYILNEPETEYRRIKIETEEDVFVRGGLFKKLVPKAYATTCSFTGMQLTSTYGHHFIDACHIVPFSLTHDDKISNGIALCPNMHRAFDRGLLSIDENYRLLVSPGVIEDLRMIIASANYPGNPFTYHRERSITPPKKIWNGIEKMFLRGKISLRLFQAFFPSTKPPRIYHVTSTLGEVSKFLSTALILPQSLNYNLFLMLITHLEVSNCDLQSLEKIDGV